MLLGQQPLQIVSLRNLLQWNILWKRLSHHSLIYTLGSWKRASFVLLEGTLCMVRHWCLACFHYLPTVGNLLGLLPKDTWYRSCRTMDHSSLKWVAHPDCCWLWWPSQSQTLFSWWFQWNKPSKFQDD